MRGENGRKLGKSVKIPYKTDKSARLDKEIFRKAVNALTPYRL